VRVLFVSSLWPPSVLGGAEMYAARLSGELAARGHEVGVVTAGVEGRDVVASVPPWPYRLDDYTRQSGVRRAVFHLRDVYDPITAVLMRRAIGRFRPDIVHSHSVAGLSTAALTAPGAAGVAHVHHLHDYWLLCQRSSFTQRDGTNCDRSCTACVTIRHVRHRLLARRGPDVYIAPSQAIADVHTALTQLDAPVHAVHLPLDIAPRHAREWSPGEPVTFGFIGQVSVPKGVRTMLQAFAELAPTGARLRVAGRGPLEPELHGEGVEALGWLDGDEREAFWRSIDCLVVPSTWAEPGGTVSVEARARGVPVIASDAGGLVEHLEERSRPLVFPGGDVAALVSSMRTIAHDPRPFRPAGTSTWPTWADHVATVESIYAAALASSAR
jgi:glycosyltransferase involved in cell wall biosynthesis